MRALGHRLPVGRLVKGHLYPHRFGTGVSGVPAIAAVRESGAHSATPTGFSGRSTA